MVGRQTARVASLPAEARTRDFAPSATRNRGRYRRTTPWAARAQHRQFFRDLRTTNRLHLASRTSNAPFSELTFKRCYSISDFRQPLQEWPASLVPSLVPHAFELPVATLGVTKERRYVGSRVALSFVR
jgi:hypothetical protein